MRVAALFRHPVKGFTGEACEWLDILPGGRVAGDRVLGVRFNNSTVGDDAWGTKLDFVALINTPGLAKIRLSFDHAAQHLRIGLGDQTLFDGVADPPGRAQLAASIERYVLGLEVNPLASRKDRLPLRVVGDGITPRYQDREPGFTTLHGRGSLGTLATVFDEAPAITELRFRSNVVVDGIDAWAEQRWVGRALRVGGVEFNAVAPVTRCLATHANPNTGRQDLPVMKTLRELLPTERPTFAILMTSDGGGRIRVGDRVEAVD